MPSRTATQRLPPRQLLCCPPFHERNLAGVSEGDGACLNIVVVSYALTCVDDVDVDLGTWTARGHKGPSSNSYNYCWMLRHSAHCLFQNAAHR